MKKTLDYCAFWRGCLLLLVGVFLPLSALAEEVKVADSNGNELRYEFDADGPATFIGVSKYSDDVDKAGRIVIADRVTDANGAGHDVLYIAGSLDNRDNIVSVVFGQNIIATGGADGRSNSSFSYCRKLESVTLNSKLQILGSSTFYYCSQLSSINLEAATSLTAILNYAFNNTGLTAITIPASVETFGTNILSGCSKLESITFNAANVPDNFYSNYYNSNNALATVNIGAGVKSIGESAFAYNRNLSNLIISPDVSGLVIGKSGFYYCDALENVSLPKGVTEIGNTAFRYIDSLRTVTIASGSQLQTLGEYAFANNQNMTAINLDAATSLTAIQSYAFYNTGLTAVTIPASIETFGTNILSGCNKLETITFNAANVPDDFYSNYYNGNNPLATVNIGSGVKRIGKYAFAYNRRCTTLTIDKNVADLVIGEYAFTENDRLDNVTLPKGVTALETAAFRSCDSMYVFTFADGSPITKIPRECFYYNLCLQTLTLPDAVQTVEESAFGSCTAMREITFGTGLTTLPNDWYLFSNCQNLKKVTFPGANYPFTGSIWFPDDVIFYVHVDLVDSYRNTSYTKDYHVMAIGRQTDFAVTTTAGGQLQSKVPEDLAQFAMNLTIAGPLNGSDINYLHSSFPCLQVLNLKSARIVAGGDKYNRWQVEQNGNATVYSDYSWATEDDVVGSYMFQNMQMLQSLTLPDGITKIGDHACAQDGRRNLKLAQINIPSSVKEIGEYAFWYTGITEATVPDGVTRLEPYTFYRCEKLQKITLPDGITFIGNSCFSENYALQSVNIPAKVETISEYAFYNNIVKTSPIVLPATLKSIGYRAFMYNNKVENITFSEGLETIRSYAFSNCNAVRAIVLPGSLTTLENNAFEGCDSITEFRFPAHITQVPDGVLYHCDKLQKVVLAEGTTRLGHDAFNQCPQLSDINISTMNTLTYTGRYVFQNTGFTTMTLPNSITEMDYCTFQSCKNLTSVNVPTGIDYVPYDFCEGCEKLVSVRLHDGIRTIRHDAFYGCRILPAIELNDQITSIEYNAFRDCDSLAVLTIPAALTQLGDNAFYNTSITAAILPEGLTKLGTGIFYNCQKLSRVTLPKNLKRITNYMFQRCTALEQIQIPDSVREIGYAAFDQAGLTSITLPDSIAKIEGNAFSNTNLRSFRVPDGFTDDMGSYTLENCKHLKSVYFGRNQDYTQWSSFTCVYGCDSLELMRVYAGTPPKSDTYRKGFRQNCVLEVPEDQVEQYRQADFWKDFKEIRGFFSGDELADQDFAVLQELYRNLDGSGWSKTWDLTNNHNPNGKWAGVTTAKLDGGAPNIYGITSIDLSAMNLKGQLPASLFQLKQIQKVNLAHNHISGDLGTYAVCDGSAITELNLEGNCFTGDLYPLVSQLPQLTSLNVAYNQITGISQPLPKDKLSYGNIHIEMQFVDWHTHETVVDNDAAPIQDVTVGVPFTLQPTTLFTYRHDNQDYGHNATSLARPYYPGYWTYDWEFNTYDGQLNLGTNSDNYFRAPKNTPVAFTDGEWHWRTVLLRFDWADGDVNADQTVDVTDLQSVIYHALYDRKADGQMFNFTTADANSDSKINVSDIVGSVDYILNYHPSPNTPRNATLSKREHPSPYYYNRAPASQQNILAVDGNNVVLNHPDAVAALQLTITGAAMGQLRVSESLKSQFSVAMREVDGGVRIVVWSADGHTLTPGVHQLLTDLPAGASVTDVRLSDSEARHLDVTIDGDATSLSIVKGQSSIGDAPVYDLSGRRMGAWESLPEGVYVIRMNGKLLKVKK